MGTYLIDKYSGPEWNMKATANRLVDLLTDHRTELQAELAVINAGRRVLKASDFLGPKMRARRRLDMMKEKVKTGVLEKIPDIPDNSDYFFELEKTLTRKRFNRKKARAERILDRKKARAERILDRKKARIKAR